MHNTAFLALNYVAHVVFVLLLFNFLFFFLLATLFLSTFPSICLPVHIFFTKVTLTNISPAGGGGYFPTYTPLDLCIPISYICLLVTNPDFCPDLFTVIFQAFSILSGALSSSEVILSSINRIHFIHPVVFITVCNHLSPVIRYLLVMPCVT